jgi:anti-sigma factor ChrR (cupin superfamily)
LRLADDHEGVPWLAYKEGVDIFRLYGDGISGPTAALLRYHKGGEVPAHVHMGYEHILMLAGSQEDEHGIYNSGTLMINPPGTKHTVRSPAGCIVLAIYEKPVRFLDASEYWTDAGCSGIPECWIP